MLLVPVAGENTTTNPGPAHPQLSASLAATVWKSYRLRVLVRVNDHGGRGASRLGPPVIGSPTPILDEHRDHCDQ